MGWDDSGGGLDLDDIAPDAMGREEAMEQPSTETVLVWADPGDGKTHLAYTMPDPVVIIDTEGKAHDIAHKFDGIEGEDDPFIFHVNDYDEAKEALQQALKILNAFKDEYDVRGTVVVDSMSKMWEWSKTKYKDEKWPNTDNDEIELGFDSGIDVWNDIKNYHNEKFRDLMKNQGFNVCWTARRKEDVNAAIENDLDYTPYEPEGENGNAYEADTVLHVHRNNPEQLPEADMEKCGFVKHHYSGLTFPTYEEHKELVDAIDEVEIGNTDMDIEDIEEEFDVRVFEGKPKYQEEE